MNCWHVTYFWGTCLQFFESLKKSSIMIYWLNGPAKITDYNMEKLGSSSDLRLRKIRVQWKDLFLTSSGPVGKFIRTELAFYLINQNVMTDYVYIYRVSKKECAEVFA